MRPRGRRRFERARSGSPIGVIWTKSLRVPGVCFLKLKESVPLIAKLIEKGQSRQAFTSWSEYGLEEAPPASRWFEQVGRRQR